MEATESRLDYLNRRADESEAAGNSTAAKTFRAAAFKEQLKPQPYNGPTLAEWNQWLDGREADATHALAFLDHCHEHGRIDEKELEQATKSVRFFGDSWLTEELTRLQAKV